MIEIENFLNVALCSYLINFYENNKDKSTPYYDRKILRLSDDTQDRVIEKAIKPKYKKLYPKHFLSNIEIVKWPIGEEMDWHDDTIHFDQTTITYLNEGYLGGRTQVEDYIIEPKTGKIIFFDSIKKHKVSRLETEIRYILAAWFCKQ